MTEEVKITPQEQQEKVTQQAAQPQPPQLLTYQQVKQVRQIALQMLHRSYTSFMQSIGWMSGDEKSLNEGMELIDAGFLSLQKAILLSPVALLPRINLNPVPQPEAPTQQEKAQEVEKAPEEQAIASEPELTPAA